MIIASDVGVFMHENLDLETHMDRMKRLGYEVERGPTQISDLVSMTMHRRGGLLAATYTGIPPNVTMPIKFQFRSVVGYVAREVEDRKALLREAEDLARTYQGLIYNCRTRRPVTLFFEKPEWNPLSSPPVGGIASTEDEKRRLLESWNLDDKYKSGYLSCVDVDGIHFIESGHILSDAEIFGGEKDARTTDLLH